MIRILTGDCRDVLPTLEAGSVHCVVCSPPYYALRSYLDAAHPDKHREIGSEATPDEYIQTMVEVFREVRRVLRDDGTCWVNMGDSYASSNSGGAQPHTGLALAAERCDGNHRNLSGARAARDGLPARSLGTAKPKDLLMMPARLALALQADGWWLRSDIIWAKPNPMPESVTDRCVSAHEHIFMLTKKSRYFFDAEAIREEGEGYGRGTGPAAYRSAKYVNGRSHDNSADAPQSGAHGHSFEGGRSCRNVWFIATHAFPAAHFATFPPELAERCIKAGTSERGCCAQCGKPWVRVTERSVSYTSGSGKAGNVPNGKYAGTEQALSGAYDIRMGPSVSTNTTGWSPGCQCNADVVPCIVLDPFSGAGTSGLVADRLGRDAVMIDLNHQYVEMARERLQHDCPLFADITDAPVASEDAYDRDMRDLFAEVAD